MTSHHKSPDEYMRQYRIVNKVKLQELNQLWIEKNFAKVLLNAARRRATKSCIPFTITLADVVIPKYCPVLGIELKRSKGTVGDASPTLDRFVPALGYVPGNVAVISMLANRIKTNATSEQIELVLKWLRRV
jgi:hypothetical protein